MPVKKQGGTPTNRRLQDGNAYNHISREERFLFFIVPEMGTARAARCFVLDKEKVNAVWKEFTSDPLPVNLD